MTAASPPTAPIRVLVADDDAHVLQLVADQLAASGHQVIARAASGRGAVEQAALDAPDVVVLDVRMPDGSGIDAAREIAAASPATAVVLFTGHADATLDDAAVAGTGAMAFLPKPTPRAQLDATVRLAAARARELAAARDTVATAKRELDDRKLIERAKGLLMRRTGASEQEAYRILQRTSQDRSVPMTKIAQAVLDSEPRAGGR